MMYIQTALTAKTIFPWIIEVAIYKMFPYAQPKSVFQLFYKYWPNIGFPVQNNVINNNKLEMCKCC